MRSAVPSLRPFSELAVLEAAEMARLPRTERFLQRMGSIASSAEKSKITREQNFKDNTCTTTLSVRKGSFVLVVSQASSPLVSSFCTYQAVLSRAAGAEFVGKVQGVLEMPGEWPMHAEFAKDLFDTLAKRELRRLSPRTENIADKKCYAGLASSLVDQQRGSPSPAEQQQAYADFSFEFLKGM